MAGPAGKGTKRRCKAGTELLKSNNSNSAVDLERVALYTGKKFAV